MEKLNITELESFRHGLGAFRTKQGRKHRWGIMDTNGNIVVEPHWDWIHICSPETVILRETAKSRGRYYDIARRKFIPGIAYSESSGRVVTQKGGKQGLEDLDGNTVIPHKYRKLRLGANLVMATDFRGKHGLFYVDGTEFLPVRYDDIHYLCRDESLIVAKIADEWFFADASGERPLKRHYDYLGGFDSQRYCIFGERQIDEGKMEYMLYGLIDRYEHVLIPAIYAYLRWLGDNRLSCSEGRGGFCGGSFMPTSYRGYGVIDCCGNEVISCVYPQSLTPGPAKTYIADVPYMKYEKGEIAYQAASSGSEDYVTGVVDETGRIVLPFRDWQIMRAIGESFRVYDRQIECCGLYSSSGEEILPIEFDRIDDLGDTLDYIAVRKNGEWYYVNSRNERVLL